MLSKVFLSHVPVMFLLAAASASSALQLRPGTFVREGVHCEDAPNAVQFEYHADGRFSYPHASDCANVILDQSRKEYTLRETCTALGDGTPTDPVTLDTHYKVSSPTIVKVSKLYGPERRTVTYRLCPAE